MAVQISGNDITVPRDGSFTRNVTIGGTLTYEDVTNIDSVGLVTARNGIEVGASPGVAASISVDGNMIVSGVTTFTPGGSEVVRINSGGLLAYNDVSFFGDSTHAYWDKSANQFLLADNTKLSVGSGSDLQLYHDGTHTYLNNITGNLRIQNNGTVKSAQFEVDQVDFNDSANSTVHVRKEPAGNFKIFKNLSVAGVSTFSSLIDGNSGATINNIRIGVTDDNVIDTTSGNLRVDSTGGTTTIADQLGVIGISTFSQDVAVAGITTTKNLLVTGVTTFNGAVNATSIDVPTATVTTKLGVGSTETPVSDIQIIKQDVGSNADLQVSALNGISAVKVGREIGTAKTHTSEIRFGGGAGAPYSQSGTALDIINYDTGNFNYHLSGDNASAVIGDFHWHKGINSARLMTLTGIGGSLGIGNTQPTKELDVTGAGNFTGDVTVGNNLTVGGSFIGNLQGTLTGNVTGTLEGNSNVTVGISTLNNLTIAGIMTANQANITSIGIGTDPDIERPFRVNDEVSERFFVSPTGSIGVQTSTILPGVGINASQTVLSVGAIGVGVTIVHKAVDFSNAGLSTNRMMVPPKINGTAGLQDPVLGALVFNTLVGKLQYFNGSIWKNVGT